MAMRNLYLIGFMGSGKSAVAKYLVNYEHMTGIEMDAEIERREKKKISAIFSENGEEYFRRKETELLREISGMHDVVVSCGGGVIKKEENIRLMKESGSVVLLSATAETVLERLKNHHDRPLLEGRMNVEAISMMMKERAPLYNSAADYSVCVDRRSVAAIGQEILRKTSQKEMKTT